MNMRPTAAQFRKNLRHCRILLHSVFAGAALLTRAQAITIVATFDTSITSHPQAGTVIGTIRSAAALYENSLDAPAGLTVYIKFQAVQTGIAQTTAFSEPVAYLDYVLALRTYARSFDDVAAMPSTPAQVSNPVNGYHDVQLRLPLARALGFTANPPLFQPDGTISLNLSVMNLSAAETDSTKFSLFSMACREIGKVLGFNSTLNGSNNGDPPPAGPVSPVDLFRYNAIALRSFTTAFGASAFFALDDGLTTLVPFNQDASGDFSGWSRSGGQPVQVQDAFPTPGTAPGPGVELRVLDVIGYNRFPRTTWVDFTLPCPTPCGSGTIKDPFSTFYRGTLEADEGGTVVLKPGTSHEQLPLTITKPLHIVAFGGPATIGP
jgi:hypothetical protein